MYSKAEKVCVLSCGDGFVAPLPTHPKAKGRFSPILTEDVAAHVLRPMEPPCLQDAHTDMYVARGFAAGGTESIVTVVWFRVDVARPRSDLRLAFELLRRRVVARAGGQRASKDGAASFVASGVYIESGMGVLAGRGRRSTIIDGKARSVPFLRHAESDDEELLSEIMCGVASVAERVDRRMVSHEHERCIERGHQYPRQSMHGDPFVMSHQVAIRACGGPNDPHGSDLHVDSMDGRGNAGGGWTVYAGESASDFDRLAVFASTSGGTGFDVRVGGHGRDWACAVHLDTARRLHGSVWPEVAPTCTTRVGFGLRIVTYTLRRIELLEESIRASSSAAAAERTAIDASTAAVKRRMTIA